jgi:hypothetical protein
VELEGRFAPTPPHTPALGRWLACESAKKTAGLGKRWGARGSRVAGKTVCVAVVRLEDCGQGLGWVRSQRGACGPAGRVLGPARPVPPDKRGGKGQHAQGVLARRHQRPCRPVSLPSLKTKGAGLAGGQLPHMLSPCPPLAGGAGRAGPRDMGGVVSCLVGLFGSGCRWWWILWRPCQVKGGAVLRPGQRRDDLPNPLRIVSHQPATEDGCLPSSTAACFGCFASRELLFSGLELPDLLVKLCDCSAHTKRMLVTVPSC